MTIEHNENFDLAYRFITETSENIFLTGKAGTGKTTFLKYLKEHCTKNTVVAAPTGVAAINAGGVTLHSLFQLPFHPFIPTAAGKDGLLKNMKYNKQRQQLLRKAELLIIDEISMVRCDVMDAIDTVLRSVRRNYRVPFGGMQVLCIGDLHQLAPVAQNREWEILQEYYASPFFFDSHAVKEQQPLLIQLEKIYRQKEQSFVDLLNNVRINSMTPGDFEQLYQRFIPGFRPPETEKYITLTSHNNQANLINNSEIQRLLKPAYTYAADVENNFPENLYPADASLVLKEGAQVMFIKNDPVMKRYFNGKLGTVSYLENEKVIVECDGEKIEVFPETWENSRYTLNRTDGKLQQDIVGTFTQYPLRLAWAITIHKSQGLTFEKVMIDAAAAFSSGQVYVALSRCTSLAGIVLLSKIPPAAIQSNSNVDKGHRALTHSGSLAERFEGARQVFVQELLQELFSFEQLTEAAGSLTGTVSLHCSKMNADAMQWSNAVQNKFSGLASTGQKFIRQAYTLMKDEPVIEDNAVLQGRITAAAEHFIPQLQTLTTELKEHPLVTEHRDAADAINEPLNNLAAALHFAVYLLEYGRKNFSVIPYLEYRLNYAQQRSSLTCYASGRRSAITDVTNPELYETLKRWRDKVCEDEGAPVFMVVTHAGLKDICAFLPRNKRSLLLIAGFGKVKVDKYGDDILDAVNDYCERYDLQTSMEELKPAAKKERKHKSPAAKTAAAKPDTKTLSFSLFTSGKKIAEIAKERGLAGSTIEGHLAHYVETGSIDIAALISKEKEKIILKALKDHEGTTLSDIKLLLPDISYGEMRFVLAAEKFKSGTVQDTVAK